MGHVFVPLSSTALLGVPARDAGVASALVNTMQQVGGSLGIAFLNTVATSATAHYALSHGGQSPAALVHGFTTAFAIGTVVLLAAAALVATLVKGTTPSKRQGLDADPYPDDDLMVPVAV